MSLSGPVNHREYLWTLLSEVLAAAAEHYFSYTLKASEVTCIYIAELGHSFSLCNLLLNMLESRKDTSSTIIWLFRQIKASSCYV